MRIKNIVLCLLMVISLAACNNEAAVKGELTVTGEIKNIEDQHVYLEQIFFSEKNPEVLDTAEIKNGKFSLSAIAPEEGLYRLRLEKRESGFIFINDRPAIDFKADINDVSLEGPVFSSPANHSFKAFLSELNKRSIALSTTSRAADSLHTIPGGDSLAAVERKKMDDQLTSFNGFLLKVVDTSSDPVLAMFALGYSQNIPVTDVESCVAGLAKRFPDHQGIKGLVASFNEMMAQKNKPAPMPAGNITIGSLAPDFTMADTLGKPFSLKQLRGKYVLVDFWASWCAPCRGENPNIVAAYNRYKNKNFTVLGVSLDDNKAAWLKAIKDDHLTWMHVSDLKGWSNATVRMYGYEGIPYNVLLDPQGRIIATSLTGAALERQLAAILK